MKHSSSRQRERRRVLRANLEFYKGVVCLSLGDPEGVLHGYVRGLARVRLGRTHRRAASATTGHPIGAHIGPRRVRHGSASAAHRMRRAADSRLNDLAGQPDDTGMDLRNLAMRDTINGRTSRRSSCASARSRSAGFSGGAQARLEAARRLRRRRSAFAQSSAQITALYGSEDLRRPPGRRAS